MPEESLIRTLLLPELSLVRFHRIPNTRAIEVVARREAKEEYCPRCATRSTSGYDRRRVRLKDAPFRDQRLTLIVHKRRLWCKPCGKPFTEPLTGVRKGFRHTERFGRAVLHACETYSDLSRVRRDFKCSAGWLYWALYRHLELRRRMRLYPWPERIGIDEHYFRRGKQGFRDFVSVIVDAKNHRLMEVVDGRTRAELEAALEEIPGRENVRAVALDLCDPFKNFARSFFPTPRSSPTSFTSCGCSFPPSTGTARRSPVTVARCRCAGYCCATAVTSTRRCGRCSGAGWRTTRSSARSTPPRNRSSASIACAATPRPLAS